VLLSTQTTSQGAVTQLRAVDRNTLVAFIVDMACRGTRAILYEVIPYLQFLDCGLPKFLHAILQFVYSNHKCSLLKLPLNLHFATKNMFYSVSYNSQTKWELFFPMTIASWPLLWNGVCFH
jgi:hypothetical protein